MRNKKSGLSLALLALACFVLMPALTASAVATITIVNVNAPGVGFNDPSPRAPIGGNPGTTLGQQRLNVFTQAAQIWGSTIDSNVEILIQSSFEPLTCTPTQAVLGSAGTILIVFVPPPGGFGTPPFPGLDANTFYGTALANKRLGFDAVTGPLGTSADDIRARFNSSIGTVAGCLTGLDWYYGFDNNHGINIDLLTVLLHEFAHGLNFQQFASVTSGAQPGGLPDVFNRNILDLTTGKMWPQMTNAERVASAINTRKVVWAGPNVTAAVPGVLAFGYPFLQVNSPAGIAGNYEVGLASFGGALTVAGITGQIVQALDPDPPATDGCTALTNAAAVAGNIALIDRGTCGFNVKAANAQAAGASAVIIANNVAGSPPPGLGGTDPTITIPTVSITLADANTIKANLAAGVSATLHLDDSVRAGAVGDQALLYTPNPVAPGSTISHWDTAASPNQLMEPAINGDLTHSVQPPQDLTLPLLRDVGWFPDANLNGIPDNVEVTAFSPALVWTGLKNSDDVGTKFDLRANVMKNGSVIASGETDGVPGGSSGFNNAALRTINLALSTATSIVSGDTLSITLSVRIAANSGHRSGTARLWYNDGAAASRFDVTIGGTNTHLYLLNGFVLGTSAGGGPKNTIDVFVDRAVGGNPWKTFGTWSKTY